MTATSSKNKNGFEKVRILRLTKLIFNWLYFAIHLCFLNEVLRHDLIIMISVAKFM